MKVVLGKKGVSNSYQKDFLEEISCVYCGGIARMAFTAKESKEEKYICDLHPNDPEGIGYWVHDACAVAVYFCKQCLETTARMNQG